MTFEEALALLKQGKTLTRLAWKDPKQRATLEDKFYRVIPCQVAHYTHAKLGWTPLPNDLLATDWELIE